MAAKLLAFSGSLRKDSFNHRLIEHAANLARARGAEVSVVRLAEFPMPVYNQDEEDASGLPDSAIRFRELMKESDGFLISCPEYNGSISAALKNTIDWATRPYQNEQPLECFKGKVVGLMAASPGGLGGIRGLDHVREILSNIQCYIVPGLVSVGSVHEAFGSDDNLTNDRTRAMLDGLIENTVNAANALHGGK